MGRRRKKKKKSQRSQQSAPVLPPKSPASEPAPVEKTESAGAEVKQSAPAPASAPKAAVTAVAPDAPWETWPALKDEGQNPVRLPYDHGGIPLLLLLFYMTFLGFSMTYMANWLVPDLMIYFFGE